ncbi:MAG: tripartite tricarboxylate transporter substrate binding protein [Pigmentiphaga sp.]|nr:tripartite tricarboxylate transporter substrate binding protein [Pigmentiphaga sp.]
MKSINLCAWLFAAALTPAAAAAADNYPSRPITLVVPYTPGSGIDIIARTFSPKMNEKLSTPVVVDNRPGASGNIGADHVAKSKPDGYTLMVNVNTFTITPSFYKDVPYDPARDFTPISQVAIGKLALAVNAEKVPANTIDEFLEYARKHAASINYGSPGAGTPQHLAMEIIKKKLDLDLMHIPYKGAAGASTDLLGGQIQAMVLPVHTALSLAETKKIKILAVSGDERVTEIPNVPSFKDLKMDDVDINMYYWVAGPANLDGKVVAKLDALFKEIISMPDTIKTFEKQGLIPAYDKPENIREKIAADVKTWKAFVEENKLN